MCHFSDMQGGEGVVQAMNTFGDDGSLPVFYTESMMELQLLSSSKGNQRKWYFPEKDIYVKEQFFYQGKYWKDYLVEVIASEIGKQLPARCTEVLEQHACTIRDEVGVSYGVYSDNFANNLSYVSFSRILSANHCFFEERADISEKWDFVLKSMKEFCQLDYTDCLITMTVLDYLVGNEDRHLNNFGVLCENNGVYRIPPLFDFGLGLFEHDLKYEHKPFRECVESMYFKPFHRKSQKVIDYVKQRYPLEEYLPKELDLTGVKIPNAKGSSYLRNRCMQLGIPLKGVE